MSSYLTLVVIVKQVHHISVCALTLDDAIMVLKAKHEVHLWQRSIEDGGEECHNERQILLKKQLCMDSTSGSCNGTKR